MAAAQQQDTSRTPLALQGLCPAQAPGEDEEHLQQARQPCWMLPCLLLHCGCDDHSCPAGRAKDALEAEGELTPLQQFVETEARDLTRASFGDFVRDLFHSIQHLVASAPLYAPAC